LIRNRACAIKIVAEIQLGCIMNFVEDKYGIPNLDELLETGG